MNMVIQKNFFVVGFALMSAYFLACQLFFFFALVFEARFPVFEMTSLTCEDCKAIHLSIHSSTHLPIHLPTLQSIRPSVQSSIPHPRAIETTSSTLLVQHSLKAVGRPRLTVGNIE